MVSFVLSGGSVLMLSNVTSGRGLGHRLSGSLYTFFLYLDPGFPGFFYFFLRDLRAFVVSSCRFFFLLCASVPLCLCLFLSPLIFAAPVAMVLLLANSGMTMDGYLTGLGL